MIRALVAAPIRLTNYLMHHGEFASGLTPHLGELERRRRRMEPAYTEAARRKPASVDGAAAE